MKQQRDRAAVREPDARSGRLHPELPARNGRAPRRRRRADAADLNPRLVYCSISGFGSSGPYAERPSYDSVAQALSGFLSVVVDYRRPQFLGPALADAITGMYASQGILARAGAARPQRPRLLMSRSRCSRPWRTLRSSRSPRFSRSGETPTSADRPRLAQAYILRTADERLIAIHLSSLEKFWQGLVAALEAPELQADPRFNPRERRIAEYETLRVELDARFARQPLEHWVRAPAGGGRSLRAGQSHRRCRARPAGASIWGLWCRSSRRTRRRGRCVPPSQFDGASRARR